MSDMTSGRDKDVVATQLNQLLSTWWFNYDEWNAERLRALLTDEAAFSCRTDSGKTDYEDFVRANVSGADAIMAWQKDHRLNSPYPLRHNSSNIHIVEISGDRVEFVSYIFVTKIVDGRRLSLSSGTACGAAHITAGGLLLARLDIMLDTTESVTYAEHSKQLAERA
jgi:hypothetical protein